MWSAFPYYGGSSRIVKQILPMIPRDTSKLIEGFCGSAVLSINAAFLPMRVCNDKNADVPHLLQTIRDHAHQLKRALELTPYHAGEFASFHDSAECHHFDSVERARRIFIRFCMSRAGGGRSLYASDFSRSISETRGGMAGAVAKFRSRIMRLEQLAALLATVQFECGDFEKLTRYDSAESFWYLDPPFEPETRTKDNKSKYEFEMGEGDYQRLFNWASSLKGRVLIISYDNGRISELFDGWERVAFDVYKSAGQGRGKTQVIGWMNENLAGVTNSSCRQSKSVTPMEK